MGSSTRKKAEKKKAFQKQKLKVGKTNPKASNVTDTSFKSKGIVLRDQSLGISAPGASSQLTHHVSMLASKSESQRRDSLSFIANQLSGRSVTRSLPQSSSALLVRLLPLSLDSSQTVRSHLLKVLRSFRAAEVQDQSEPILLHVRAGMTHIAAGVRETALDMLAWALDAIASELVTSAGGWTKTLRYFALILGWPVSHSNGAPQPVSASQSSKLTIKSLGVLGTYLVAGLHATDEDDETITRGYMFPLTDTALHRIPRIANPYAHLGLFRSYQSDDNEALEDRAERQAAFQRLFRAPFEMQLVKAKKEGGELGRAAAGVTAAIKDGMADFEDPE